MKEIGRLEGLTEREQEILEFTGQGLTNREIAQRLCVSHHTIKAHIARILRKLNIDKPVRR